jgi:hypothetical protein
MERVRAFRRRRVRLKKVKNVENSISSGIFCFLALKFSLASQTLEAENGSAGEEKVGWRPKFAIWYE